MATTSGKCSVEPDLDRHPWVKNHTKIWVGHFQKRTRIQKPRLGGRERRVSLTGGTRSSDRQSTGLGLSIARAGSSAGRCTHHPEPSGYRHQCRILAPGERCVDRLGYADIESLTRGLPRLVNPSGVRNSSNVFRRYDSSTTSAKFLNQPKKKFPLAQ